MLTKTVSRLFSSFTRLTDTPSSFSGKKGQYPYVSSTEDQLKFRGFGRLDIRDYGPAADGKYASEAAMTSGSSDLTTDETFFEPSDVGKPIRVKGAGTGGGDLASTIDTYVTTSHVKLVDAAETTVSRARAAWGTDDSSVFNSALASLSEGDELWVPPGYKFNLNNNLIASTANGQTIKSEGRGAYLLNGGVDFAHQLVSFEHFRLFGPSTYGMVLSDTSFQKDEDWGHLRATQAWGSHLHIEDKEYGLYNEVAQIWNRFFHLWITNCNYGAQIGHEDASVDSGDWHFTTCRIQHCDTAGMMIYKIGGLVLCDTKFQFNYDNLVLKSPLFVNQGTPTQGTYVVGSQFEDATRWNLHITAEDGVDSDKYPRWNLFVGCTFGGITGSVYLDKATETKFAGSRFQCNGTTRTLQHDSGATGTVFLNPKGAWDISSVIEGDGDDYVIIDNESSGPVISAPNGVTVKDSVGSRKLGGYKTTVAAAPDYISQRALVSNEWYTAAGVSSADDWIKDSGGGGGASYSIDGGAYTDPSTDVNRSIDAGAYT